MTKTIDCYWPLWPRQEEALNSEANDQLFGGASEGGKSYFTRVAINSAGMECEGLQMTLIRKKSADILTNHLEGDKGFRKLLYPLTNAGIVEVTEKRIRFPKGNVCNFKHCQDERQFDSAQGNENQIVCVDEAPQIQERLIRAFRGWCRITPEHLARQPLFWQKKLPWFLQTGNPTGASVGYFRKHYVKARPAFAIEEVGGFRRQYVPSKAQDNKSVNLKAHAERLSEIGDAALARALDLGDWDAPTGDFYPEYDEDKHVVEDFSVPRDWFKFRTFDWGSAEPFAVYWWCVSDGTPVRGSIGKELWFPSGSLIAYREWYGCDPQDPAKGIRMRNNDIARGILNKTTETTSGITITDNLPFQDRGFSSGVNNKKYTVADVFADEGCQLLLGNTARIHGWSQLRDRLIGIEDVPLIYITESCKYLREYLPAIPRHPTKAEDAAEHGEATHAPDAARLACTARPITFKVKPPVAELPKRDVVSIGSVIQKRLMPTKKRHLR